MHTFIHVKLFSFIYFLICVPHRLFLKACGKFSQKLAYRQVSAWNTNLTQGILVVGNLFIVLEKNKQTDGEIWEKYEYRWIVIQPGWGGTNDPLLP